MSTEFQFPIGQVNIPQLRDEIERQLSVRVTLINIVDSTLNMVFERELSQSEESALNSAVLSHVPVFIDDGITNVILKSPSTDLDIDGPQTGIPYVYATSRPLNHYVCFQGAGDTPEKIGGGKKCIFKLNSRTPVQVKEFTFNESVHLKDGYMITKDAPMGSSLDVDIIEPISGVCVGTFARTVPLYGSGWFPLDTEDRGFLPKGFIIRVTIRNSSGGEPGFEDDDYPADFYVSGRFELYRPRWPEGVFNK